MTPAMTAVQMAVLEIMKACVLELKSSNPAVSDQSDCLFASMCTGTHDLCLPCHGHLSNFWYSC